MVEWYLREEIPMVGSNSSSDLLKRVISHKAELNKSK